MAERLPIDATHAESTFRIRLDGVFFVLRLAWNIRDLMWTLGISDSQDVSLAHGIPVRVGVDVLANLRGRVGFPPGALTPIDSHGQGQDPGRKDFGDRVWLIYLTADEVASA